MNETELRNAMEVAAPRRCNLEFVRQYYGLDLQADRDPPLRRDLDFWATQRNGQVIFDDGTVDRWLLELFLQTRQLVSTKWAAARLGMQLDSLRNLLKRFEDGGPVLRYHESPDLMGKSLEDDLNDSFPEFRTRTFDSHNAYCRWLHSTIRDRFGIEVTPEFCATSVEVGNQPPDFAEYFDILTMQPLSVRYQIWLDFKKWLTLPPDRCSVRLYAEFSELLRPHLAGRSIPDIPDAIRTLLASSAG